MDRWQSFRKIVTDGQYLIGCGLQAYFSQLFFCNLLNCDCAFLKKVCLLVQIFSCCKHGINQAAFLQNNLRNCFCSFCNKALLHFPLLALVQRLYFFDLIFTQHNSA